MTYRPPAESPDIETQPPPIPDEQQAVVVKKLTKSYGSFRALKAVDLVVRRNEVFGFLGPNGAGKTTTIRCLLDLIRPNEGTIRVLGIDPQRDPVAVRRKVGYLPGELNLDDNLNAGQTLRLFDGLRGGGTDWNYVDDLAERLSLAMNTPVKNFSKGNKQKVGVLQAFMSRPELLLLDEPTSGLDPLIQRRVLELVTEAKNRGATIFFSSHNLREVQEVSERVAVVREGEIVEVATTDSLIQRVFKRAVISFENAVDRGIVNGVPGVTVLQWTSSREVRLRIEGPMTPLFDALSGVPVRDFETERPTLEEVFLRYYSDDEGDSP